MIERTPISWWRTRFGDDEIGMIADSIRHEHISQGPVTTEFELKLGDVLGVPYVVATTSGSMALLMALLAAGVGPGDEVIVPNRTWIASAHAAVLLGARAVLADVEHDRPTVDVDDIERKITAHTKVIMPVHLNGRAADMEKINRLAAAHGVLVVEDAAQAFCSRNRSGLLGCQSFAGCFSLSVPKIISTGQGGFVATRDAGTYERLNLMRTHGVADVVDTSYTQMGFNFRFTDILASIGLVQVRQLPDRINYVKKVYAKYAAAMPDLPFLKLIPVDIAGGEIPIYVEILCPERDELVHFLAGKGIQTRPFYPDLDLAGYFGPTGELPNSRVFGREGLFLPSGPSQSLENVDRVLDALCEYGKRTRR